jgi:hypothetical protein
MYSIFGKRLLEFALTVPALILPARFKPVPKAASKDTGQHRLGHSILLSPKAEAKLTLYNGSIIVTNPPVCDGLISFTER